MPVIGSTRRPMTAGRSMVGARRFAEGGDPKKPTKPRKPVNPEEGDLNPFGKDTVKTLNEIRKGKKMAKGGKCYAKGGYVSAADGCVSSGRTKGRFV